MGRIHRLKALDVIENIGKLGGKALFLSRGQFQPGELSNMPHLVESKRHDEANYSRRMLPSVVEQWLRETVYNEPASVS